MDKVFEYNGNELIVTFRGKVGRIFLTNDLLYGMGAEELMAIVTSQLNAFFGKLDLDMTISEAATFLAIHPSTLRLWEKDGKISPSKTVGGHRRYSIDSIKELQEKEIVK